MRSSVSNCPLVIATCIFYRHYQFNMSNRMHSIPHPLPPTLPISKDLYHFSNSCPGLKGSKSSWSPLFSYLLHLFSHQVVVGSTFLIFLMYIFLSLVEFTSILLHLHNHSLGLASFLMRNYYNSFQLGFPASSLTPFQPTHHIGTWAIF